MGRSIPGVDATAAAAAFAYQEQLDRQHRKRHGVWFTPLALALPTTRRVLLPLLREQRDRPLRIVDPAVGGGTFLLAALRVLTDAGIDAWQGIENLFGLDLDPTAAQLAAAALTSAAAGSLTAATPQEAHRTAIRPGDGLLELEPGTFDAVLTNPPWETLQSGADAAIRVAALRPLFRHQGRGKLQTYRLFVERACQLLRPGGRLGMIVPASLWFDRDAEPLRRLLLDECDWQWLFGFENKEKVFAIDSRYRFGAIIAQKAGQQGGATHAVRVAFGRTSLREWADEAPPHTIYGRDELRALSPHSGAFVEVDDRRDLDILRRMHANGQPLLGAGAAFTWRQGDYNMTADRDAFVLRAEAEAAGHRRDTDGVWRRRGGDDLLPLYQGAMIHELHPNFGAHAGGTGHSTQWEPPAVLDDLRPAYLVAARAFRATALQRARARIALRALSNATNERTAIACLLPDVPCGNSLGVLEPRLATPTPLRSLAALGAILSSLAFDWALRLRLGGTNLNRFVLTDCVLPRLGGETEAGLARLALRLCALLPWHEGLWQTARAEGWAGDAAPAPAHDERRALLVQIDALVGDAFGLTASDVAWIVRGCDVAEAPRRRSAARGHAKGLWRIDRHLPPAERRPNRWLAAARRAEDV